MRSHTTLHSDSCSRRARRARRRVRGHSSGVGPDVRLRPRRRRPPRQSRPTDVPFAERRRDRPGTDLSACEIVTAADIEKVTKSTAWPRQAQAQPDASSTRRPRTARTRATSAGSSSTSPRPTARTSTMRPWAPTTGPSSTTASATAPSTPEKNHRAFFWKGSVNVMLTIFLNDADPTTTAEELGTLAIGKV